MKSCKLRGLAKDLDANYKGSKQARESNPQHKLRIIRQLLYLDFVQPRSAEELHKMVQKLEHHFEECNEIFVRADINGMNAELLT